MASGMAYYSMFMSKPVPFKVISLLSDGELNEGSTWEAIMFAAHHRLSNLTAVIDANGLQSLDTVENTLSMHHWISLLLLVGMSMRSTVTITEILNAFQSSGIKPKAIIGHTVKGKGVSFMEEGLIGTTNLQLRMICERLWRS